MSSLHDETVSRQPEAVAPRNDFADWVDSEALTYYRGSDPRRRWLALEIGRLALMAREMGADGPEAFNTARLQQEREQDAAMFSRGIVYGYRDVRSNGRAWS